MSYSLYKDKQEIFEAQITLTGASVKDAFCRLIVESDQWNLVFPGSIDSAGNVKIPVKKLKNVLDEGTTGKMKLEVVAENTYFSPWDTDFVVKASKSLQVEVKQQTESQDVIASVKTVKVKQDTPVIKETRSKTSTINKKEYLTRFIKQLMNENITLSNMKYNKERISEISDSLLSNKSITDTDKQWIIDNTLKFLIKQSK